MFLCLLAILAPITTPENFLRSPLADLDQLIEGTEAQLRMEKELHELMTLYLSLRHDYLKDEENRELLRKTARAAYQALEIIKAEKLGYLFSQEFLSELSLFAKLGAKPSLPRFAP